MRVDIGAGVRLYVDIDGPGLVPDGATMRQRPTIVFLHGGPGMDRRRGRRCRPTPGTTTVRTYFERLAADDPST